MKVKEASNEWRMMLIMTSMLTDGLRIVAGREKIMALECDGKMVREETLKFQLLFDGQEGELFEEFEEREMKEESDEKMKSN